MFNFNKSFNFKGNNSNISSNAQNQTNTNNNVLGSSQTGHESRQNPASLFVQSDPNPTNFNFSGQTNSSDFDSDPLRRIINKLSLKSSTSDKLNNPEMKDIILEIERKILASISNKESDNRTNDNEDTEENEDYTAEEFNEKKEIFFLMKKILLEMQTEMKIPINSIDTLKKFASFFPAHDTIKIATQYLLRLYDVYKEENNETQKAKTLEYLKTLCFTDVSFDNFNKNFDFPKPLNSAITTNEMQLAEGTNEVDNKNIIKSVFTEEMRGVLEPNKIIEIFNKIYKENESEIKATNSSHNQSQGLFNPLNNSGFNLGGMGLRSNNNNAANCATSNTYHKHSLDVKIKLALELLRIINPFYLYKYFDIQNVDEKLFTYFLEEENTFFLTSLFYKNSNCHSRNDANKNDDYLINLISKFLTNTLGKEISDKNPLIENLKRNFMLKIPSMLTLDQVEKIVSELDKTIPTKIIHPNFWYDLLLSKKFKNEVSLSESITSEEKYNLNLKILEYIKEKNFPNTQIFKSFILLSLLKSAQEFNNFNLDLFLEYIKNPFFLEEAANNQIYKPKPTQKEEETNSNANFGFNPVGQNFFGGLSLGGQHPVAETKKIFRNSNIEFENGFIFKLNAINLNEEQGIIEKHLLHFFVRENQKYEKFFDFFRGIFLKKIYYIAKLYRGFDKDLSSKTESLNDSQISESINTSSIVINREDFSHFFSKDEFENLVKKTELNILKLNKTQFKIEDDVKIEVEFKNIQNLILKIFEINTENYYYNTKKSLDSAINLEGLIPFQEEIYIFNEKPEKLVSRTFELEKLPKKRGVYIAEFIGRGLSARAIIKKGNLKLITKPQSKGVNFFILDEDNNICKQLQPQINQVVLPEKENDEADNEELVNTHLEEKKNKDNSISNKDNSNIEDSLINNSASYIKNVEKKTGIWYKNKFYAADKTGLVIIPYLSEPFSVQPPQQKIAKPPSLGLFANQPQQPCQNQTPQNDLCIISHNGFSEIANLIVDQESYTLKGFFHSEDETLLAGNTAKFIAKPFLFLNNLESKSYLLKNIKITATIRNDVNGEIIPTTKIWDKIKLNDLYEYPFELQIPAKVNKILLSFEAEVFNNSKKINEKLRFDEEFKLNSHYGLDQFNFSKKIISSEMRKLFLKRNYENDYSIFVLGKNGEAIKNANVCLKLFHKHLNYADINLDWNLDSNFNIISDVEDNLNQIHSMFLTTSGNMNNSNTTNNDSNKENFFQILCKKICFKKVFLQTDRNGEIKLGNLSDFRYLLTYLIVDDEKSIDNKEYEIWNLENTQTFNYPRRIDKLENENIAFPLAKRNLNEASLSKEVNNEQEKNVILIQVFKDNEIYRILNDKIKFIELNAKERDDKNNDRNQNQIVIEKENDFSNVERRSAVLISGLEKGKYKLILGNENTVIHINIHEGSYWHSSATFIISKKFNYICENTESSSMPVLQNLNLNIPEGKIKIKFNTTENIVNQLNSNRESNQKEKEFKITPAKMRLHVLAYNFIKNESFTYTEKLLNSNNAKIAFAKQKLTSWDSLILPSRSLNEEIQYVLERKNYEKLLGNLLEKPTLLMKRKFIGKTKNEQKQLKQGTAYQKKEIGVAQYNRQKAAFTSSRAKVRLNAFGLPSSIDFIKYLEGKNNFYQEASSFKFNKNTSIDNKFNEFSGFKNFLFESSKFIIDIPITAGEEKEISIPDLSKYSNLHLICTASGSDASKFTCLEELISLSKPDQKDNLAVKFKDISLKKALDLEANFTELRSCEAVEANSEYVIENILSNNFKLIDSLEKVAEFQVYLRDSGDSGLTGLFGNTQEANLQAKFKEFRFLLKFDELSEEKQKEKISKYFSHEFNFYIYMKYPQIFEKLIRPIVMSKIEKRFVDYFLLKDEKQILKFLNIHLFNKLNLFEKCLLIRFVAEKDSALAKNLAKLLRPMNYEKFDKKLFDLMIHSKIDSNLDKNTKLEEFIDRNNATNDNLNFNNANLGGGLFGTGVAHANNTLNVNNNNNCFGFGGDSVNNNINTLNQIPFSNSIGFQQPVPVANFSNFSNCVGLMGGPNLSGYNQNFNNSSSIFSNLAQQQTQTIPQQSSLFGAPAQIQPQQQQTTSLFGGPIVQQQTQQSSLFGAPTQIQPQQQQPNLFSGFSQTANLFSNTINNNIISNVNNDSNTLLNNNNNNQSYEMNRADYYQNGSQQQQNTTFSSSNLFQVAFSDQQQYQKNNLFNNGAKRKILRNDLGSDNSYVCEFAEMQSYLGTSYHILNEKFWYDYATFVAEHKSDKNFVSKNLLEAVNNFQNLILTLAVLDLPAKALEHAYEKDPVKRLCIKIKAKSNLILFTKKLVKAQKELNPNLIVNQKVYLFNANNRNNNKNEFIEKEFLPNKIYCHETNIINTSYENYVLDLLIQIPEGAIPLLNSDYKRVFNLSIGNQILTFKSYFYFAKEGEFNQHGPSLSKDGLVIAKAENKAYKVLNKLTTLSKANIQDILECGLKADIIDFFRNSEDYRNSFSYKLNLKKIFWILKDKQFYTEIISIVKSKFYFDIEIWAFAFFHKDENTIKELLDNLDSLKKLLGPYFKSSLLEIDETTCFNFDLFEHREFYPIVNNRFIYINNCYKNFYENIENLQFRKTYEKFLLCLFEKLWNLDNKDYLRLAYYLILQDRVNEAKTVFRRLTEKKDLTMLINSEEEQKEKINADYKDEEFNSIEVQCDYIKAYLDFSDESSDFKTARDICLKYKDFPMKNWRELFEEIKDQLDEYDASNKEGAESLYDDILKKQKSEKNKKKSSLLKEPKLSLKIQEKTIKINYTNLDKICIRFYLIDLEILFSTSPFFKKESENLSFVNPNFEKEIKLEKSTKESVFEYLIPKEFQANNFIIEISSDAKKLFKTYFSNELEVNVIEALGEIKITDRKLKPIPKAYIKCFAKLNNGKVTFFKDGFTDLRGKFNYLYNNILSVHEINMFSIFVFDEELGSAIKLALPPAKAAKKQILENEEENNDYDYIKNIRNDVKSQYRYMNKN